MRIELEIGGNGEGKILYCPLCRRKGQKVKMREGEVLVRSSRPVLQPRPLLELLQRPPLRVLLNLRVVKRFMEHHEQLFYRLYFSPYKQVEGYLCEAVPSHGLTRETYLRAVLGEAAPAKIAEEMGEIQEVYRETLWAGLG
ncbi:MAG: hypothetical protein ACE5KR_02460 [Candidatus Bipolaricaulia bacterium]